MNAVRSIGNINEECLCCNFRKITRAITQIFDQQLEPMGLRSTQLTILISLMFTEAKALTEIAHSLIMDRTTLTRNLKPLLRQGLIIKMPAADRRARCYSLTEVGKKLVRNALPIWRQTQYQIVENLGKDNYHNLLNNFTKLHDIIKSAS